MIALRDLEVELDPRSIDDKLRRTALAVSPKRAQKQLQEHERTVSVEHVNYICVGTRRSLSRFPS